MVLQEPTHKELGVAAPVFRDALQTPVDRGNVEWAARALRREDRFEEDPADFERSGAWSLCLVTSSLSSSLRRDASFSSSAMIASAIAAEIDLRFWKARVNAFFATSLRPSSQ